MQGTRFFTDNQSMPSQASQLPQKADLFLLWICFCSTLLISFNHSSRSAGTPKRERGAEWWGKSRLGYFWGSFPKVTRCKSETNLRPPQTTDMHPAPSQTQLSRPAIRVYASLHSGAVLARATLIVTA